MGLAGPHQLITLEPADLPTGPAAISPSPPGIRVTLAIGAPGFSSTAPELPRLTVSTARAGDAATTSMAETATPHQACAKHQRITFVKVAPMPLKAEV